MVDNARTNDGRRDIYPSVGDWAVTDHTEDLVLDCDTDDANLGDNLGTLITQLIKLGILKGSVIAK